MKMKILFFITITIFPALMTLLELFNSKQKFSKTIIIIGFIYIVSSAIQFLIERSKENRPFKLLQQWNKKVTKYFNIKEITLTEEDNFLNLIDKIKEKKQNIIFDLIIFLINYEKK